MKADEQAQEMIDALVKLAKDAIREGYARGYSGMTLMRMVAAGIADNTGLPDMFAEAVVEIAANELAAGQGAR